MRLLLIAAWLSTGCGRFGFDALVQTRDDATGGFSGDNGSGPTSRAWPSDGDAGALGAGSADAPTDSSSTGSSENESSTGGGGSGGTSGGASGTTGSSNTGGSGGTGGGSTGTTISDPPRGAPGDLTCSSLSSALACNELPEVALASSKNATSGAAPSVNLGGQIGTGLFHGSSSSTAAHAFVYNEFAVNTSDVLYLRARMGLPSGFTIRDLSLLSLVSSAGNHLDVKLSSGGLVGWFSSDSSQSTTGSLAVPRDAWFCLEATWVVRDQGRAIIWLDGQRADDIQPFDTLPGDGIMRIAAGVTSSGTTQNGFDVYVDEFAVSTSPLPTCD